MKNNFTIKDVAEYLENLPFGWQWVDYLIKDEKVNSYRRATVRDFKKPVQLYIKTLKDKSNYLITIEVNNEKFLIRTALIKEMDASDGWKVQLEEKANNKISV